MDDQVRRGGDAFKCGNGEGPVDPAPGQRPAIHMLVQMRLALRDGAPWWIRTTGPQLRRLLLYPTELRALIGLSSVQTLTIGPDPPRGGRHALPLRTRLFGYHITAPRGRGDVGSVLKSNRALRPHGVLPTYSMPSQTCSGRGRSRWSHFSPLASCPRAGQGRFPPAGSFSRLSCRSRRPRRMGAGRRTGPWTPESKR